MKTIQEVCKIVGITRRTLQEYNRIGLLSPSNKNRKEYDPWLYSDEDINKLLMIQLFVSAGYPRKAIKEQLSSDEFNITEAIRSILDAFQKQREKLKQQTDNLKLLETIFQKMRDHKINASEIDYQKIFQKRSFKDCLGSAEPIDADMIHAIYQLSPFLATIVQDSLNDCCE